jgi:hypothetical protein
MTEAQVITLDEVIQSLLVEEGKSSEHEYLRYFNLGLKGLKELNFDTVRQIKATELSLDSKNTVTLPSDYVKYVRIGAPDSDGKIQYLGYKRDINLVPGSVSTDSSSDDTTDPPVFHYNAYNDGLWGRYGQGGGNNSNGYYRVNFDAGTIEFSDLGVSTIILEYISDGSTGLTGEDIRVHVFAEEALRSYIYWKSIYRKRGINMNEKQLAKREYYNQKRLARARMLKFTKSEALQTTRKAFKQAPKI